MDDFGGVKVGIMFADETDELGGFLVAGGAVGKIEAL